VVPEPRRVELVLHRVMISLDGRRRRGE